MTALPKRKQSTFRTGKRRRTKGVQISGQGKCSNCGQPKITHHLCSNCGYYRNKKILPIKKKGNEKKK